MNFEEWLESKGHIDGYRTDYQSAYDEGFDEGVKTQQTKIGILQIKLNGADERSAAVLSHKNKMIDELQAKIDELQRKIAFQEKAIKNIKLQFENKQIDCDRSDRKINELQARVDEIASHLDINFDEDRDDDQHSYWSGYNQAMRELNDILKGNKDEN